MLKKYNYHNAEKLEIIFLFWLKQYEIAVRHYDYQAENNLNIYSYISAQNNIIYTDRTRLKGGRGVKQALKTLLSLMPIYHVVLPGGKHSNFSSYYKLITYYKLVRINLSVNNQMLSEFENKIKKIIPEKYCLAFNKAIPLVLFSKPINIICFSNTVYCSPSSFFDETYIKLLFMKKKFKIIGLQHGGNYGEYKLNYFEFFEKQISDKYLYWGLGKSNIIQNRYKINQTRYRSITHLGLVEGIPGNELLSKLIPLYKEFDPTQLYSLYSELRSEFGNAPLFLIKHPKLAMSEELCVNNKINSRLLSELSSEEMRATLFVLDRPGHTFFYQALYQGLPFVFYINRSLKKYFTPRYLELLSILEERSLLYYWDQRKEFFRYINSILYGKPIPSNTYKQICEHLKGQR